jgi:hypothetical protein
VAVSVAPAGESAEPTRSAARLLHGHMDVEDVPVRIKVKRQGAITH